MFSLEPHSPSFTVVLSDTSEHSAASVDAAVPPATKETEPEATSAPTTAAPEASAPAPETQHTEANPVLSEALPMDVEARAAEPEAENNTNANPETSKDSSEAKQATSPRLPKDSNKPVPEESAAAAAKPQASLTMEVPQAPLMPQGQVLARSLCLKRNQPFYRDLEDGATPSFDANGFFNAMSFFQEGIQNPTILLRLGSC